MLGVEGGSEWPMLIDSKLCHKSCLHEWCPNPSCFHHEWSLWEHRGQFRKELRLRLRQLLSRLLVVAREPQEPLYERRRLPSRRSEVLPLGGCRLSEVAFRGLSGALLEQ